MSNKISGRDFLKPNLSTPLNRSLMSWFRVHNSFIQKGWALKCFFEYDKIVYRKDSLKNFNRTSWVILGGSLEGDMYDLEKYFPVISPEFFQSFFQDVNRIFTPHVTIMRDDEKEYHFLLPSEEQDLIDDMDYSGKYSTLNIYDFLESFFGKDVCNLYKNPVQTIRDHYDKRSLGVIAELS